MVDKSHATWQEELAAECRKLRLPAPVFNILSDRRGMTSLSSLHARILGGRTAWTSTVTIQGHNIPARNWYDGQFINNAKEDAAEVALIKMRNPSLTAQSARSGARQSTASYAR